MLILIIQFEQKIIRHESIINFKIKKNLITIYFQEIWQENENRQSPTNILDPVFDDAAYLSASAPFSEDLEEDFATDESNHDLISGKDRVFKRTVC